MSLDVSIELELSLKMLNLLKRYTCVITRGRRESILLLYYVPPPPPPPPSLSLCNFTLYKLLNFFQINVVFICTHTHTLSHTLPTQSMVNSDFVEMHSHGDRLRQKEGWFHWVVSGDNPGEGEWLTSTHTHSYIQCTHISVSS